MAMSGFRRKKELSRDWGVASGLSLSLLMGNSFLLEDLGAGAENTFLFLELLFTKYLESSLLLQNRTLSSLPLMMLPLDPLLVPSTTPLLSPPPTRGPHLP